MKPLVLVIILLTTFGCQWVPKPPSNPRTSNSGLSGQSSSPTEECADKPEVVLKPQNVKSITLSESPVNESGIARKDKALGYTFEAKPGQEFHYSSEDNICIWIYTPNQQLLTSTKLPSEGIYTLQISTPTGLSTFEIEMSLKTVTKKPTITSTSPLSPSLNSSQQNNTSNLYQPSPEKTIEDYYSAINQQQYQTAWNELSYQLQNDSKLHPNGYASYTDWWTTVAFVEIHQISLVDINSQEAIVDTRLTYIMQTGRRSSQSLQLFLLWNSTNNKWEINKAKTSR